MKEFSLTIPGRPVPFTRPGEARDGHRYTPAEYEAWLDSAAWRFKAATRTREFDGPVVLEVTVRGDGIDVTVSEHDGRRPKGITGDLDNYVKAVGDALQRSGVIGNDRQVLGLLAGFAGVDYAEGDPE